MALRSSSKKLVRFAIIGGLNTVIDFALLFLLTGAGLSIWVANICSTSVSLAFSFFANRSFTFGASAGGVKQVIAFLAVTLLGLWGLQPLVMHLFGAFFPGGLQTAGLSLFVAKVIATVASMTWNFLLYQKLVFARGTVKG